MPKTKSDRTAIEWIEHGENLLSRLSKRTIAYREISANLELLKSSFHSNEARVEDLVRELNNFKDKLPHRLTKSGKMKSEWSLWVDRIRQQAKDKERSRFYVSSSCRNTIDLTATQSGYKTSNQYLENMSSILVDVGIDSTSQIFDIYESLEVFMRSNKVTNKVCSEPTSTKPKLVDAVKNLITNLNAIGIKDSSDLFEIKKRQKHDSSQLARAKSEIEKLEAQLLHKDEVITKLREKVSSLEKRSLIADCKQDDRPKKALKKSRPHKKLALTPINFKTINTKPD
ncbi:hypothetical protein [Pseudoalteromonas sp. G4]|uniref:hypothetical protein n=1 Tax=Pseudoalteromonas sp. G4 TaxID=2992761 RepID=UPI00237E3316|nr:hypothetical protein [Pseudoalteromonas sp. G4]MDE3273976.1 hypothetical protein [Pseudoalteromonas sp. G4]